MNHVLRWEENQKTITRLWVSESAFSAPKKILIADDSLTADEFYRKASEGAAYIYRGDFQNAKQLLQAVQRRIDKNISSKQKKSAPIQFETLDAKAKSELFHRHRQTQAHRAQLLSRLLVCISSDYSIPLRRAPDATIAIREALGENVALAAAPAAAPSPTIQDGFVLSLRELLGCIGAHEWRKKGVLIPFLNGTIHPHYGIFSPGRGEYLDLIEKTPLPQQCQTAFDIGTGTGVIAAILAKRKVNQIIATDIDDRALTCAQENIARLGFTAQVDIQKADLFPLGAADLIVCNPPWLPVRPTSPIERALYDENHQMLKRFLTGAKAHLTSTGEVWLVISDLAVHLGLRKAEDLETWFSESGLSVIDYSNIKPRHSKAEDTEDPLYFARSKEVTRLWRLK